MNDFDYLDEKTVYLDAACQSLRPRPVVETINQYYLEHNSCGERVKYPWGEKTDAMVEAARKKTLKLLKLKEKDYFVSFTLNTTYGINLLLNEICAEYVEKVFTSDIEHNSPFLATMALARRLDVPRVVLKRVEDGSLPLEEDFHKAVLVVNCAANFDGRQLVNLKEVIKKVHGDGGLVIVDAAQAMAHYHEMLEKTEADAICFSAHKMYAPSLGVMVVRRDLVPKLTQSFIGGGMVDDVFADSYLLSAEANKDHVHTIFEAGLQAWGEICAYSVALDWLGGRTKADKQRLTACTEELDRFLRSNPKVKMVGKRANPTMSFYVEGLDSHLLGAALGKEGIMARTGYFCAHYYLDKVCKYPSLVRFSLSYATRESDVERVKQVMGKI
jgi:cysteine desulfurase/selenocysteine lyase